MSERPWRCIQLRIAGKLILLGTNGDRIRFRHAGMEPIDEKLVDCKDAKDIITITAFEDQYYD